MIILGIDPGIATVGYGIVAFEKGKFLASDHGAILTPAHTHLEDRLNKIYDDTTELIKKYKAEYLAIEELFFNTNQKTAISVAQGRGVVLLAAKKAGIPIYEFTPLQVKQSVVGYGRAEKKQVMTMTKIILNLEEIPKPDDAADALALAICLAHSLKYGG